MEFSSEVYRMLIEELNFSLVVVVGFNACVIRICECSNSHDFRSRID